MSPIECTSRTRARASWARLTILAAILTASMAMSAAPALASPGHILAPGSDIASDSPYAWTTGGKTYARVNVDNRAECPPGITDCWLEIRWSWKARTSIQFSTSPWIAVKNGQDYATYCANGSHRYNVETRIHWNAAATRTVETWGQTEKQLELGGSIVHRLIPKFLFVRLYGGVQSGTQMGTTTGVSGQSGFQTIASTGGGYLTTTC